MAGAEFIRADLHVHTYPDIEPDPIPPVSDYIAKATSSGLSVLGVTDHNSVQNVREAVTLAESTALLVLPGIEISTHEGHLLGLFSPSAIAELEAFAHPNHLQLVEIESGKDFRSNRSMLDLVNDIWARGGLAIPAHVDAVDGIATRMPSSALADLLKHPGLAGLEFATRDALTTWFTDQDPDASRRAAWLGRQAAEDLRDRGLARVMSSDAHSPTKVGDDRTRRTLTRLRLDQANFAAVRNAVLLNPKARCKAEAILPLTYPRILNAQFSGGFLDGVKLDFSGNLTCIIGGRGSGKSTALLAIRAALGAPLSDDEDPDDIDRMPDVTTVRFIDGAGSERTAERRRGLRPLEPSSNSPIELPLADLGQGESGRLARGYTDDSGVLLEFLDTFVDLRPLLQRQADLVAELDENGNEIVRTNLRGEQLADAEKEHARLEASLKAAETGKVEELARWATLLASEDPLLARIEQELRTAATLGTSTSPIDIDLLAAEFGVDLTKKPASEFVEGADRLRERLIRLQTAQKEARVAAQTSVATAVGPVEQLLREWKAQHADLQERLEKRQRELEEQGLRVQAGAIRELAKQLNAAKTQVHELRKKKAEHEAAVRKRTQLLNALYSNWDSTYEKRRATLKRIVETANRASDELKVHAYFEKRGMRGPWIQWLTNRFGFRMPRVQRLSEKISPSEFAEKLLNRTTDLLALKDDDQSPFFAQGQLDDARTWANIFELQTMRLEDRPRIEVQEPGSVDRRAFDHLSAGQQRSILLSLVLCAERDEPLVLDQPEDHLDAQYIATSVVRHLETAKERRQVILATHSPNLTVLGDAELVIPMYAEGRRGGPRDPGAVDRIETRERVCALLEGGAEAFRRRGERYGFTIEGP